MATNSSKETGGSGVLSKIKNDFSSEGITGLTGGTGSGGGGASLALDGVTRCIALPIPLTNMPTASSDATGGAGRIILPATTSNGLLDVISSLKDLVLVAFESIVREREEMIKRGEAAMAAERLRQVAMDGMNPTTATTGSWRFERFFLMKETLASTFQGVGLLEDALRIYDELEAALVQVLRQDAAAGQLRLGLEEFQRDAGPLLQEDLTRARRTISTGNATVYDFRCYLFRRQIALLGAAVPLGFGSGRTQAALALRRGVAFIVGMGQWLRDRELSSATAAFTIEAWTYDAAQSLAEACARWVEQEGQAKTTKTSEDGSRAYHRLRAELLSIALSQLDRVGVLSNYLPPTYPFILSSISVPKKNAVLFEGPGASPGSSTFAANDGRLPTTPQAPTPTQRPVSPGLTRQLIQAARSPASFFEQYDRALKQTIDAEDTGGRFRERQTLTEKQAGLAFHQMDFEHARKLYVRLLHEYLAAGDTDDASWLELRQHAFVMMLECRERLQLPPDRETILLGLEHLKVATKHGGIGAGDVIARIVRSWDALREDGAARGLNVLDHPVFDVRLVSTSASALDDEDGWSCVAEVTSRLSVPLSCDDVRLAFAGNGIEHVWCTAGATTLQPGRNRVALTCLTPLEGMYRLQASLVMCGKLVFEHDWTTPTEDLRVLERRLLRIAADPRVLHAELRLPRRIALDEEPTLELVVETRRNDVARMTIALGAPGETVAFRHEGARFEPEGIEARASGRAVTLGALSPDTSTVVTIPYAHLVRTDPLHARISIDYTTAEDSTRTRKFRSAQTLHLALPIAVNVQDFFRPDRIISRFTASSPGRHALRIKEAKLEEDVGSMLQVTPFRTQPKVENVTPESPVSFLFSIKKRESQQQGQGRVRLRVLYRTVEEEVRLAIAGEVEKYKEPGDDTLGRLTRLYSEQAGRDPRIVQEYLDTGRLNLIGDDDDRLVKDVLHRLSTSVNVLDLPWRTLEIPVDIPAMQLVCATRLVFSDGNDLCVGQARDVRLEIEASYAWNGGKSPEEHTIAWEILVEDDGWQVNGDREGEVVCNVSMRSNKEMHSLIVLGVQPHQPITQIDLVLTPILPGNLPFPHIACRPKDPQHLSSCEFYQEDAACRVNVHVSSSPILMASE